MLRLIAIPIITASVSAAVMYFITPPMHPNQMFGGPVYAAIVGGVLGGGIPVVIMLVIALVRFHRRSQFPQR